MELQVNRATYADVAAWLQLAAEVVPLFGPMPGFNEILARKIIQQQAFCARTGAEGIGFAGGIFIGGGGSNHAIRWLAVSRPYRRRGVGRLLVETALKRIPPTATVSVDTFIAGNPGAEAAIRLYESCGFVASGRWGEGDAVRQRLVRPPRLQENNG